MTVIDKFTLAEVDLARKPRSVRTVQMKSFGLEGIPTIWISLSTAILLVALWWFTAEYKLVSSLFLPHPAEVVHQFFVIARDGYAGAPLTDHVLASLFRIGLAAVLAIVTGIPLGLLMGLNRWAKGILDTPIEFYWPLPPLSYLPLMIIWLGIGETPKITLLYLAMFAPICLAARSRRAVAAGGACTGGTCTWRVQPAAFRPYCPSERAAGNPHRYPYRARRRLGHAGGSRTHCLDAGHRLPDHVCRPVPGNGCGFCRHCHHLALRLRLCLCGAAGRAVSGAVARKGVSHGSAE